MTATKTDAWMPLWIGVYLADTMRLTTVQHGAYLLMLMAYWRERAPLPDDDEELRSITKTDKAEWKRMRPVLVKFFKVEAGVWWHKRVEKEMADADARSKAASGKAQAAANARWGAKPKDATGNAPSIPGALPEDVLNECPTPTPLLRNVPKGTGLKPPDGVSETVWRDYLATRKAKMTDTALKGIQREATKAGVSLEWVLKTCCERGWRGFKAEWMRDELRPNGAPKNTHKYAGAAAAIFDMDQQPEFIDV